jgi:glycosyltransferase involved in cell wall biosynthesis
MKIALVNYRYFISGGPERYLFNIKEILERNGHTVVPFSIKHNKNVPSEYEHYFLSALGKGDAVYASDYKKGGFRTMVTAIGRMLYSFEAKRKFKKLLKEERPDIVYVLYYQNKLSASVIDAAYEMKIPVVQRISDFGHICVNNIFYIYQKNEICERCLHGSRLNGVRHKCVNNSYFNSLLKVIALKIQDFRKTTKKISAFVIPAEFTSGKFREFGIPASKINCIPTFYNSAGETDEKIRYDDFFLYVGRVDRDKGVMTLVKAFEGTPYKLKIIGSSINGYDVEVKNYLKDKSHQIEFLGQLDFKEIRTYLGSCLSTLCPSECYDNLPNSVLESYAYGKGVIASRLGALVDMVKDNQTGLSFTAGDHLDLRSKVRQLFDNREEAIRLGNNGKARLMTEFSESLHYDRLMYLFNSLHRETN